MSRVYFQKPSDWGNVYVWVKYRYDSVTAFSKPFPGRLLSSNIDGIYSYDIDSYYLKGYLGIEFNNGVNVSASGSVPIAEKSCPIPLATKTPFIMDGDVMFDGSTLTPYLVQSTVSSSTVSTITVDNSNVVQAINTNNSLLYCFIVMFFVVLAWYFFYKIIKIFV